MKQLVYQTFLNGISLIHLFCSKQGQLIAKQVIAFLQNHEILVGI